MADIRETVTLPDETEVEVLLRTGVSVLENMNDILESTEVKAAIEKAAKAAYPALHYRHGNDVISSQSAGKVVQAFLESGEIASAEEVVEGWADEYEYYAGVRRENFATDDAEEKWGLFLTSAADAIGRAFDKQVFADELEETFEQAVYEALREADDTAPLDQMRHALPIGLVHIAGYGGELGVEDLAMRPAFGAEVSASTVRPDEAFRTFLEFVNMGSDEFRDAVLAGHGVDLWGLPVPADASDLRREDIHRVSADWRSFEVSADPSRRALVTPEQVVELLDNASYGGVPVAYAYVSPKDVLDLPWSDEAEGASALKLEPERSGGRVFIGIHDFLNGSGHSVDVPGPVTLPLDHRCWHVDGERFGRCGIDSVYGLAKGVFRCRLEAVQMAPAPEADAPSGPIM